jgi:predicted nicotinamide N-methyase
MDELMKLKKKTIIIDNDFSIDLKEQTIFLADGKEGLHLWESSVVLTRFVLKNSSLFSNKNIIELGTGCGLLGISILKKINVKHFTFSDYNEDVLNNLKENIKINKINNKNYEILKLDWRDYNTINNKYDIIIGSELIYQGGFIKELVLLIDKILNENGLCYICMPEQRSMTNKFLELLNENNLNYKKEYFTDNNLFRDILNDKEKNKKLFENLSNMKIMLYTIQKKKIL